MRHFSKFEKGVIRKLTRRSRLSDLLSWSHQAQMHITWPSGNGGAVYKFTSDSVHREDAYKELVDVIQLLKYLESENLITRYHPAATTLDDQFEQNHSISLGDAKGTKIQSFQPDDGGLHGIFLKGSRNSKFEALEPLKRHVRFFFYSPNENTINILVSILALLFSVGAFYISYKSEKSADSKFDEYIHRDSIQTHEIEQQNATMRQDIHKLKSTIDSLVKK